MALEDEGGCVWHTGTGLPVDPSCLQTDVVGEEGSLALDKTMWPCISAEAVWEEGLETSCLTLPCINVENIYHNADISEVNGFHISDTCTLIKANVASTLEERGEGGGTTEQTEDVSR